MSGLERKHIAAEFLALLFFTTVFLTVLPSRPAWLNILLALFAATVIALTHNFTKGKIWSHFPVSCSPEAAKRHSWFQVGLVTGSVVVVFAAIGFYQGGLERIANPQLLIALGLYLGWGLLQQFLFQFYLLGRLLVLLPNPVAIVITGVAYSLVHVHHLPTLLVTLPAGIYWSWLYYRYRVLLPLGVSHGVLGATFYYWVIGKDLLGNWFAGG